MMELQNKIAVTILTGFLGSGKSTFLNALLKNDAFKNTLVIVNEFGQIGLDHLLIEQPEENIILLEGGCLCCEVRGDLVQTLNDIQNRMLSGKIAKFDRIIIETTGLSNPIPILQSIICDREISNSFSMGKVITIVDGKEIVHQLDEYLESLQQIAIADLILVSKSDIPGSLSLKEINECIRDINPGSPLAKVDHGIVEQMYLNEILGQSVHLEEKSFMDWMSRSEELIFNRKLLSKESLEFSSSLHPIQSGGISLLSESNKVQTFSLRKEGEITGNSFVIWLNLLATMKGENILRFKAILNIGGKPVALHATQTIVHEPVALEKWPSEDKSSRFVVISKGPIQKQFERSLELLDFNVPEHQEVALINPDAYKKFLKIAESFSSIHSNS
jgi:G3E family GTPase